MNHTTVSRLRAAQTDCLPYEAPLEMSTPWLYEWLERNVTGLSEKKIQVRTQSLHDKAVASLLGINAGGNTSKRKGEISSLSIADWRAPLNMSARRPLKAPRQIQYLAIGSQINIARFYYRYHDALVNACQRDQHSLRYPVKPNPPGRTILSAADATVDDPGEVSTEDRHLTRYTSYFRYSRYSYVGQFFESSQWLALEGRWTVLERVDVANCFGSIYSHSIAWHYGSTLLNKINIPTSSQDMASNFDKVMRCSQWGETHGIPIGPEASRIFSEIVFQGIDRSIDTRLAELGLKSGQEYEYLRYMDDYFIFANSTSISAIVASAIGDEIRENGMAINSAKSKVKTLPFSTSTALRKEELKRLLSSALPSEGGKTLGSRSIHTAMKLVMLSDGEVDLTGSALAQIESAVHRYLARSKEAAPPRQLPSDWIETVWPFIESSTAQYLGRPSVPSALKVIRMLWGFWNTCNERGGTDKYTGNEYVRFTVEKIIKRIAPLDEADVELCHFLSLAKACNLELAGAKESLQGKIERCKNQNLKARSDQTPLLLSLSLLNHRLNFSENTLADSAVGEILAILTMQANEVFSQTFTGSAVRSHAAQEVLLLAVASCRKLTVGQRFRMLNHPWVRQLLCKASSTNIHTTKPNRATSRLIYQFISSIDSCNDTLGFDWSMKDFSSALLTKTPYFVY